MISISEIAKMFSITVRTVRYYEQIGIIKKGKRLKGKRHYEKEYVTNRIKNILFLKKLGFTLNEIEMILKHPLYVDPILINIRIFLLEKGINQLNEERKCLISDLNRINWLIVKPESDEVLEKIKNVDKSLLLQIHDFETNGFTNEKVKEFIKHYLKWLKSNGFPINKKHLDVLYKYNEDMVHNEIFRKILSIFSELKI